MTSQHDDTVIEEEVATKLQETKYIGEGEELPLGTSAQNHCRGKKDFRMPIRGMTSRQEISSLSAQERNHILELIHGVFVGNDDENDNLGRHFVLAGQARRSNEEMLCTGRTPSMDHEHGLSSESISCNNDLHDVMSRSRDDGHGIGGSENMTVEGKARREKQREGQTKARDQNSSVISRKSQRQTHHNVKYEHSLFIQEKLEELEQAICQIKQKDAYNVAVQDLHGYVEDPSFRLVFLRADSYNVKKAASRLVSYMGEKLKRFGLQALTRQLTIGDLGGTSKSLLVKEGVVQILPTRDSSGRAVFVAHYHSSKLHHLLRNDPKSLIESCVMAIAADCLLDCKHYQGDAVFYLMSATAEDQETQRRGIVTMCIIASSQLPKMECMDAVLSASLEDFGANFYSWCPLKCNAHHHWIHDGNFIQTQKEKKEIGDFTPFASKSIKQSHRDICASHVSTSISLMAGGAIFNTIMNCMGKEYRIRSRLHEGSFEELKKTLKTFGIPVDELPYSMDGSEIQVSGSHARWMKKRRQKDAELIFHSQALSKDAYPCKASTYPLSSKRKRDDATITVSSCFDVIDIPGRHDVCLGTRGTTLHQHTGNIAMRAMMEPLVEDYVNATSTRRQELNKIMIQAVHLIGGRFLTNQTTDGAWFEVVADEALVEQSIGSIFRGMVSRINAKKSNGIKEQVMGQRSDTSGSGEAVDDLLKNSS